MNIVVRILLVCLLPLMQGSVARGQAVDVLPDVPLGSIVLRPSRFADGFVPELVQENPVGFIQRVGPTDLVGIPDGRGNLVVAHYGGRFIRLDSSGAKSLVPFVDLSDPASPSFNPDFEIGQAHGVTSIAFHPGFALPSSNGFKKFYTLESETAGSGVPDFGGSNFPSIRDGSHHDGVLYEYTLGQVTDVACNAQCSKREVLRVLQPGWHHNLGDLIFDADEMLYVASADGSTSGTTAPIMSDNSQTLANVFGKILRIDPLGNNSANGRYGVPDNPFNDGFGGRVDEIYAYGFRNPHRLAIDPVTGDLFASETGENNVESVDRVSAGGNYGWNLKEGSFLYDPLTKLIAIDTDSDLDGVGDVAQANALIEPIFEYDRDDGRSIIGGALYRGAKIPELQGHYVFADFDGRLFYGDPATGDEYAFQITGADSLPSNIHSVNVGTDGELYVLGIRKLDNGDYDGWVVSLGLSGDFNSDGILDAIDMDSLSTEVRNGSTGPAFDVSGDGLVDADDRVVWIQDLRRTWFGDANLDQEFNSSDLSDVLSAGEYEDRLPMNSTWATGDWSGDGDFDSSDLVLALQAGGYEQGPRATVSSVPEPVSPSTLITGLFALALSDRGRCRRGRYRLARRPL